MKLVRCSGEIRHYYDGDLYGECPECKRLRANAPAQAPAFVPVDGRERTLNAVFSPEIFSDEPEAPQQDVPAAVPAAEPVPASAASVPETVPDLPVQTAAPAEPVPVPAPPVPQQDPAAEQKHGGLMKRLFGKKDKPAEQQAPAAYVPPVSAPVQPVSAPVPPVSAPVQPAPAPAAPPAEGSLASAVAAVQKTHQESSGKTVAYYHFGSTEPVVGWLVCATGIYQGESFELHAGQNFIGRSLAMDIVLKDDQSVSRENHAAVMFEPKKGSFFLMPGQSTGITYLNDDPLLAPAALSAYDQIGIGDTLLIFVPFCGERFRWEDYQE